MPITPEKQLRTLARRVCAAQIAYGEGKIDWERRRRVTPRGVIPPSLVGPEYYLPDLDTTENRIKAMGQFRPEALQEVTISPDGLHAVACLDILRDAKEFFLLH